jgi:hypothetical protein
MTLRRLILALGAILVVAGAIALLVPVSVAADDGRTVGCGNAVAADFTGARSANSGTVADVPILNQLVPHTDYVALCEAAVSGRRSWSIPLAIVGALTVVGSLVVRPRSGARRR